MMGKLLTGLIVIASLLGGCSLFKAHSIDIQQGNAFDEADVARITPGMTREQVRYILGTPIVASAFRPERWDYVYHLRRGNGGEVEQKRISVHFAGDRVERIEAETMPAP